MRKRRWAATLVALGLLGPGTSVVQGQLPALPTAGPALPTFPYNLPPAPIPAGQNAPTLATPAATGGPHLPALPATAPVRTAPLPRTSTFADLAHPVVTPVQGTTAAPPAAGPMTPSPMSGTPVGNSSGSTLPPPVEAGNPTGSTPKAGGEANQVKFTFKPGDEHLLNMDYGNGLFRFYTGGRLQIDGVWYRGDDALTAPRAAGGIGRLDDGTNFRRARFDFGGTFYKNIDFLMEWDFINTFNAERTGNPLAANTPVPTDMWVQFREVPWLGTVRAGNQKPPISFEHMTSSRFLNFLERSLGFDAFIENQNNGFELGITAFDTYLEEHGTWHVGVFKNTRNIFGWNVGDGEYEVTGRVTYLPVYEDDGRVLVHLGFGASHRDQDDDIERMRARTLLRPGPAILHNIVAEVITGASSRSQVNPEFVVVYGPWTFQSEYQRVWVPDSTLPATGPGPRTNFGTAVYQAGYAEVLYFLTGEHQFYNRKTAAFGRVTPNENFTGFGMTEDGCDGCSPCGPGAWQVGGRYSWIDLDDKGIRGGTVHDVTLGLNWFLNPYTKFQWNLEALYRNAPNPAFDGWAYGFGTRLAIDF